MTDKSLLKARKRLARDFELFCKYAVKIRTKEGSVTNLQLNKAQKIAVKAILEQWHETGKVRAILSKGRQQGMSTLIQAFAYWATTHRKGFKSLVIAHEAESTKTLFDMTKRIHEHCPDILKMSTKYSSRSELVFKALDSGYRCATAGNESAARGETLQLVHASEMAFWKPTYAEELWNGLIQAVPNAKDTFVFIESTSNGMGNLYHRMWTAAENGENGYIPIFVPWYIQDEYRVPVSKSFKCTEEEQELAQKYGLDDEQIMFRRQRISQTGSDQFKQEYPFTPEESFLTSGRPVFDPIHLQHYLNNPQEPITRKALEGDKFTNHSKGELAMYADVEPFETYTIGCDVGMGGKTHDWCVAQVLDSKKNLVAKWRGLLYPDAFGEMLYHLGMFFNEAYIIIENNNQGILPLNILAKQLNYPNLHTEVVVDKTTDDETVRLGFNTNVKSKPNMINALRAALRDGDITIPDKRTLQEMQTYIVTDSGKYEAESGMHDDCVTSLAMAIYNHKPQLPDIEVSDDYYVEMI